MRESGHRDGATYPRTPGWDMVAIRPVCLAAQGGGSQPDISGGDGRCLITCLKGPGQRSCPGQQGLLAHVPRRNTLPLTGNTFWTSEVLLLTALKAEGDTLGLSLPDHQFCCEQSQMPEGLAGLDLDDIPRALAGTSL